MTGRKTTCSQCGKKVTATAAVPVCQPCRKAARTKPCAWCSRDHDSYRSGDYRDTCSGDCGRNYQALRKWGWTANLVAKLVEEVTAGCG